MTQFYEIRVKGHLDASWADWMGGLAITHQQNGETLLSGALPDQAALHGVLNRLRDLSVPLISVNLVDGTQASGKANAEDSRP